MQIFSIKAYTCRRSTSTLANITQATSLKAAIEHYVRGGISIILPKKKSSIWRNIMKHQKISFCYAHNIKIYFENIMFLHEFLAKCVQLESSHILLFMAHIDLLIMTLCKSVRINKCVLWSMLIVSAGFTLKSMHWIKRICYFCPLFISIGMSDNINITYFILSEISGLDTIWFIHCTT